MSGINQCFRLEFWIRAFEQADNVATGTFGFLETDCDVGRLVQIDRRKVVAIGFCKCVCLSYSRVCEQLVSAGFTHSDDRRDEYGQVLIGFKLKPAAREIVG